MLANATSHRFRILFALGVLWACAGAVRLIGIDFLLPHRPEADGYVLLDEISFLRGDDGVDLANRSTYGLYPQLIPRLALLVPRPEHSGGDAALGLAEHRARASAERLRLRRFLALLSAAIVPATWLVARKFLSPGWALAASAWMGASFLHVWFAQQTRPHAVAAVFFLLAVAAALRLRQRPTAPSYLLAGAATALAIGALQSGASVLPALVAAVFLRERSGPGASWPRTLAWSAAALVLAAASLPLFYPSLFGSAGGFEPGANKTGVFGSSLWLMGHRLQLSNFDGHGFLGVAWTLWSYEPVTLMLGIGAAVAAIARGAVRSLAGDRARQRDLVVVLAHALPYLFALGVFGASKERFVIPLLPYLSILVAYGLSRLFACATRRSARPLARAAALAGIVVPVALELEGVFRLAALRRAPDTTTLAADWVRDHAEPQHDRVLVGPQFELPLLQTRDSLIANERTLHSVSFPWFCYQWDREFGEHADLYDVRMVPLWDPEQRKELESAPVAWLRGLHGKWIVLEVREGWSWPGMSYLRGAAKECGVLAARFSPDGGDDDLELPFEHQDDYNRRPVQWFWRAHRARRTGPVLEIYRLTP